MAQFRAVISGNRGEVSRLGSKKSGASAHVAGWEAGVEVVAEFNQEAGRDEFHIYQTSGSNGRTGKAHLGTVSNGEFVPAGKE